MKNTLRFGRDVTATADAVSQAYGKLKFVTPKNEDKNLTLSSLLSQGENKEQTDFCSSAFLPSSREGGSHIAGCVCRKQSSNSLSAAPQRWSPERLLLAGQVQSQLARLLLTLWL